MTTTKMQTPGGNPAKNQNLVYHDKWGKVTFRSYETNIAEKDNGEITLDTNWESSNTTSKYRNIFLGETKAETMRKVKNGEYKVKNLN